MGYVIPKSPRSYKDYLHCKRQSEIIRENVQAMDDWLEGKIDSEELKRRVNLPLGDYTN